MSIELSPEVERYVQEQVESGRFASPVEVLEAGLARLRDIQRSEEIWADMDDDEEIAALENAERQIAAGETFKLKDVAAEYGHTFSDK